MKKFIALFFLFASYSSFSQSSIFDAARKGDMETAKKLFELNPDTISAANAQGYTPLVLSAYYNQVDFALFLLDKKVKINDVEGTSTPLQAASYKGFDQIVKALLASGANPNTADANGASPLTYAAQFNHVKVVELLMKAGADPNQKDQSGLSPIDYASKLNLEEVLSLLKK